MGFIIFKSFKGEGFWLAVLILFLAIPLYHKAGQKRNADKVGHAMRTDFLEFRMHATRHNGRDAVASE